MADDGSKTRATEPPVVRVWDGPLRLWHWALAAVTSFSLYSGLAGEISLMELHQRAGMVIVGLLVFRVLWSLWGGIHARWREYQATPRAFVDHFRRGAERGAHTAPGVALVLLMLGMITVQALTGLVTTDDIFNEGPLTRHVSSAVSDLGGAIHHRAYWIILGAIGTHLTAHLVYGLWLRDPTPLSMVTGTKRVGVAPTPHFWLRAALTLAMGAAVTATLWTI